LTMLLPAVVVVVVVVVEPELSRVIRMSLQARNVSYR
jgi:hypothetical protein